MAGQPEPAIAELYERDTVAWLDAMVALIRRGVVHELDFVHLEDYLAGIAEGERREIERRLGDLLAHVLKWEHLAAYRSEGWKATILRERAELARRIRPGALRVHAESALPAAYANAVARVVTEAEPLAETLHDKCPFALDELLRFDGCGE